MVRRPQLDQARGRCLGLPSDRAAGSADGPLHAGEYDGIYTSHVRNRDSGILHAIAEFLEVARAGGIRDEISHLNVRHNTGAPDRGWERAARQYEQLFRSLK